MYFRYISLLFSFSMLISAEAQTLSRKYVADEIIVKYKTHLSADAQKNSIEREGARRLKRLNKRGFNHVKLEKGKDLKEAIAEFQSDPNVEFAQPNFIYHISSTPNDTKYGQLWGLKNTGQTIVSPGGPDTPSTSNNPGTAGKDMDLENAWNTITDCSSVVVAVLDTGINYNHSDLASNMWNGGVTYPKHGYDFVSNTTDPLDQNGHGTHVAGTIGAVGNNANGTTGVCWKVKLMAVRVLDATGSGSTAGVIQGIDFAVAQGAKVINMSLGGGSFDQAYSDAVTAARDSGVLIAAAAGNEATNNDGGTHSYPCDFTQANIICVAALSQNYSLATFSNYGSTSVDVGAPGVNIVSTWPGSHVHTSEALTSGWNFSSTTAGGWDYKTMTISGSSYATLANPKLYNGTSVTYDNNTDARAYKTFNLNGANVATIDFFVKTSTESNKDYLNINVNNSGGDPFLSGTEIESLTGSSGADYIYLSYDISAYLSANTSFGFNLLTDGTGVSYGSNIVQLGIDTLTYNNTTYNVISGTSMATPHVAGLAAMIFAYNPGFTYSDVITAIKSGGVTASSLAGKTTTGKAVSATGALSYIAAPTGGAAVKVP